MKGVEPLIGAILVIAIMISTIMIAIQLSTPGIDRAEEILILQEGKSSLISIDNKIKEVVLEGNGSSRILPLQVTDGGYSIFPDKDGIYFVMESKAQIIGVGVSKIEDGINITGYQNKIDLFIGYDDIDIRTGGIFGRGNYNLFIKNLGFDLTTNKYILNITV